MYIDITATLDWPVPNYVNPERYGSSIFVVHGVLYPIVLAMLGIRIYTRLYISKCFGLDDCLALFSMIPITGFAVMGIFVETYVGWDVHAWDVPYDSLTLGLKCIYITQILFTLALTPIRISMLWLIARLLENGAPKLRRVAQGLMIYVLIHGSIFAITLTFQCRPVSDYWAVSFKPQPNCINQEVHLLFTSICNAISDYAVVALPMHTVWKLQLPFKQRISLCMLFAIGFLASTASVVRTVYVCNSTSNYDRTWTTYPVFIWSSVEVYLGLFCACMPPSVGFWKLYYPKLVGTFNRSEQNTSKSSKFWSSKSESKQDRNNSHELADTDDEERGIIVERDVTIETHNHTKDESMGIQGSCTVIDQSPQLPNFSFNNNHKRYL
ncbi:hypothetical protein BGAL_0490g00050 [Botrytis galanthina]|uniref:Rhodopsin domain-containing protein n=1 Tax=Botrytis galanthina TaxID=278940 RepID=A0A4S8QLG4_9HELO|nr:hypothetical protein BGAL_0490g00050 [Botrytis galanthina]